MCDEIVQPSPEHKRRRRRRRGIKSVKKHKGQNDSSCCNVSESGSASWTTCDFSAIKEETSLTTPHEENTTPLSVARLYEPENDEVQVFGPIDEMFAYWRLVEKAAVEPKRNHRSTPEMKVTKNFIALSNLPGLQEAENEIALESQQNTSVVSDTQVLRLCEAADIIEQIKNSSIELSTQWESPGGRTELGPARMSGTNTIPMSSQDTLAEEILKDCVSQIVSQTPPRREDLLHRADPQTSKAPDIYSRLKDGKQEDKHPARKLVDDYDSDSKSNLSSELSMQNDDLLDATPTDCVDLHKSFRVCENLQNLSSFFSSQGFTQEENEVTVEGVYQRIMALKAKRWESRLSNWYNTGQNFNVEDDSCSADFEGFCSSEIGSFQSESSYKSRDMSTFLDEDDEVFHQVRATYLANKADEEANGGLFKTPAGKTMNNAEKAEVVQDRNCSPVKKIDPNYTEILSKTQMESQIWPDEKLLYDFSTPVVNTSIVKNSANQSNSSTFNENYSGNNSELIKDSLNYIRKDSKQENVLTSVQPCGSNNSRVSMYERQKDLHVSKEIEYKEKKLAVEMGTQTEELFLKGASQWNENTYFTGCEAITNKNTNEVDDLPTAGPNSSFQISCKKPKEFNPKIPERNKMMVGFQSAGGKNIKISEEGMLKAKSLWAEIEKLSDEDLGQNVNILSPINDDGNQSCLNLEKKIVQPPFETNTQSDEIKHTESIFDFTSRKTDRHILREIDNFKSKEERNVEKPHELMNDIPGPSNDFGDQNLRSNFDEIKGFTGFKSVSGKHILISKKSELRASNIFADVNASVRDEIVRHPMKNVGENRGFSGFKSLSGKPILISKESTNRAGNLFAEVVDSFVQDEVKNNPLRIFEENKGFTGFKSVAGTPITIAKEAVNKAKNIFAEVNDNPLKYYPLSSLGESTGFTGFKSIAGKPILVSKEAQNKANNLYSEVHASVQDSMQEKDEINESVYCTALSTVKMTSEPKFLEDYKTASSAFQSEFGSCSNQELLMGLTNEKFSSKRTTTGFTTVSGKPLKMTGDGKSIANKFFTEMNSWTEQDLLKKVENNKSILPSTSSFNEDIRFESQSIYKKFNDRENIHQKESDQNRIKKLVENKGLTGFKSRIETFIPRSEQGTEEDNENGLKYDPFNAGITKNAFTGFTTVSGKALKISGDGKTIANKFLSELNSWTDQDLLINVENQKSKPLIDNIRPESQQIYNRFNKTENILREVPSSEPINVRRQGFNLISRINPSKRLKVSSSENVSTKSTTSSTTPQRPLNAPLKRCTHNKFITPVKTKSTLEFDTPDLKEFFNSVETSTPQTVKRKSNYSLSQEISASTAALAEDELKSSTVADDFHTIKWDDFEDSFNDKSEKSEVEPDVNNLLNTVPESVIEIRNEYRKKNDQIIEEKMHQPKTISSGELYVKKSRKDRQKVKDLVGNRRPTYSTVDELINRGLQTEIAQLSFSTASDFKFTEPLNGRTVISTEENIVLIPDDYNKIGLHEIEKSFLTTPGVYKSLIPQGWIDHHYKMILLKLAMLEKSFPETFANQTCTPENILSQLKYRYDREIDRAERSCLKKILESDDTAAKRMVLLVIEVHENNVEVELELTDWWYSVRATVDLAMMNLISRGKVRVGTKLMIQGSKLLNCDNGCSPLEISPLVRLKIHTNSCRRAIWDLKLGFFKNPKPFYTSLDSVKENGGQVSTLILCILRVYPVVYLSRTGTSSQGIHSQKVEEKLRKSEEKIDFDNFEIIFSQVHHELEQEKAAKRKRAKYSSIVNNPEELFTLIDEGHDLEHFEIDLSPNELNKVMNYQQEVLSRNMNEVKHRVKEKLKQQSEKRSSTELIKIRVVDHKCPKLSAVLSIWRPDENLLEMLKEGTSIKVTNCVPNGVRYNDMQLNSTKSSEFSRISNSPTVSKIQHLFRKVTTIKEIISSDFTPSFNEVDTFGFIVMISNVEQRKFQNVFLCDADENLLCIKFWNGIKKYAYDDVIQSRRFISARNLQTRANSKTDIIPCLFATEISIFTENPKTEDMKNALMALKNSLSNTDLSTLSSNCTEKIESLKNKNVSGNSFATPVRKSLSCGRTPSPFNSRRDSPGVSISRKSPNIPTTQDRLDRLRIYGHPPDLSPITFKVKPSLRASFKLPRKLDDIQNANR